MPNNDHADADTAVRRTRVKYTGEPGDTFVIETPHGDVKVEVTGGTTRVHTSAKHHITATDFVGDDKLRVGMTQYLRSEEVKTEEPM